jgi:hypothetical protein
MFLAIKKGLNRVQHRGLARWTAILTTELVIVFVGVYAAELLAERRSEKEARARQELIVEAVVAEIDAFLADAADLVAQVRGGYEQWQAAVAAGRQPPPFYVPATFALIRPHAALWDSMLASGGVDLLPLEQLSGISEFYARTERMIDRYARLSDFARAQVLPAIEGDPGHFYNGTTELRPLFSTYIAEADAVLGYAEETVALGQALREQLE